MPATLLKKRLWHSCFPMTFTTPPGNCFCKFKIFIIVMFPLICKTDYLILKPFDEKLFRGRQLKEGGVYFTLKVH